MDFAAKIIYLFFPELGEEAAAAAAAAEPPYKEPPCKDPHLWIL
jgi:hypothetical protein